METPTNQLSIGSSVLVALTRKSLGPHFPRQKGVVRYLGNAGTSSAWVGIELFAKVGKHDGRAKDKVSYFHCDHGHGIYVRPWHVTAASKNTVTATKASPPLTAQVNKVLTFIQSLSATSDLHQIQAACLQRLQDLEQQETEQERINARRHKISKVYSSVGSGSGGVQATITTTPAAATAKPSELDKYGGATVGLVVREIHDTEISYVNDLTTMIDVFAVPLVEHGILTKEQSALLFSNIELLKDLNESMLNDLQASCTIHPPKKTKKKRKAEEKTQEKQQLSEETVGEVLGRYAPFFKLYNVYITNYHHNVLNTINALENSGGSTGSTGSTGGTEGGGNEKDENACASMSFVEYCAHMTMTDERCRHLNFKSFLIMPMQRVPRYVLLLKELIKQIHKVLHARSGSSSQGSGRKKHLVVQENMFYKGLEAEIVSIEKALKTFQSVARQIDSKIIEVRLF